MRTSFNHLCASLDGPTGQVLLELPPHVSVSKKVDEFLLGSDWLEKQGAKWDFPGQTVTLVDQIITVHCRH